MPYSTGTGWLKYTYPDDENYQVSHETIYRSLFIQARGALQKELLQHLRRTRMMRRGRGHTQKTDTHGRITGTVSIRERPASAEDRGSEMADHKRFSLDTDINVYFCDPRSPWQRGSNENTHGLLRQYFPKGMDFSKVHQNKLNAVARQLNERPRKTLDFRTPAERFNQCVAATG